MKLFNIFKKSKTRFVTGELISLNALAKVPNIDYFKDNNQFLLLINLRKKEYLETLIQKKVLTSNELKSKELQDKLNMLHNLIEQNTLGNDLFEKVIFDEEDKVKVLIILRKFTIYNEEIIELEEEVVSRIIALKEILKRTFLNKPKRICIINEINRLTNVFIILMNQKETLRVCLSNYSKKCFDITKERDLEKEEDLIRKRKKELNEYQEQVFGKINIEINDLNDMALVEVALEKYVYNYKWKDSSLKDEIIYLYNHMEKDINKQVKDVEQLLTDILILENKCKMFYEFGKNIIDKEDLKRIYHLKFMAFINCQKKDLIESFVNEETPKLELEVYEELIFDFINKLSNNNLTIFRIKTVFKEDYSKVIKLVKEELKTNGKYDPLEILKDKYKLNLLMAFSYPLYAQLLDGPYGMLNTAVLGNIYKSIYVKKCDYPELNFYEKEFEWDDNLPLETINELKLAQNQKKNLSLYLFLKKHYYTEGHRKYTYTLPEGLNKICILTDTYSNDVRENSEKKNKILKYVDVIRKNAAGKIVILPKSLISVTGDLFGDTYIPVLRLNEGLEYFNFNYLPSANIKKIEISSTVKPLVHDYHKPNNENLQEMYFYNFDKSCFYNNIDNLWLLLSPYIKITSKGYLVDGTLTFIHELTIAKLVFNFSDPSLYPNPIKLENFRMVYGNYNQDKIKLIERINNLMIEKNSCISWNRKKKINKIRKI